MKKTSLTLAAMLVGGAAPMAQAQTVQIYGLVDGMVEYVSKVGSAGSSLKRMPGLTGSLPSRLGFRGSEDLGDGLKAVFTLEQGFGPDAGTLNQGGRAWGRQVYVGLQGAMGTITLGRQNTMLFWGMIDSDVIGPSTHGLGSLDSYIPNSRADNAIAYRGSFNGFTLGATYSFGRDAVNAGPSPSGTNCAGESTDSSTCKEVSLMLKYDSPTWGAALVTDKFHGGPGAFAGLSSGSLTDTRTGVNGYVKFGGLKLGGGLLRRKNEASVTTPKSDLWYLGATYAASPQVTLESQLSSLKFKDSANKASLLVVRGFYHFSKRTSVYATAGHISNKGALALSVSGAAPGSAPVAGGSQDGLGLGLRHSF